MDEYTKTADTIIVGSGPGGATVARELSRSDKKVLILEWGDFSPLRGTFRQGARTLLWPGRSLLLTSQMLALVRGITTGGSTVHYYATSFPVPYAMLEDYGINVRKEVQELREELPVAPLKDEMVGPMSQRIMNSAQSLGYTWEKLDKIMYQDVWDKQYPFGHYGDPHRVKWTARMFVEESLENGARIINGAQAQKILFEGRKAVGVEFKKDGQMHTAYAKDIIISAGGIGSPVILRKSGLKKAGYRFFFDPLIGVRGTVKRMYVPKCEIPMTAGIHLADDGYMMTDMAHPFATTALFAAGAFRFRKAFSRPHTVQIMVKAKDELGGRLTDTGGVRKSLDTKDKKRLEHGYQRARKVLEKAGAHGIYRTQYIAAHPGGTVKVGEMLDSNLKTELDHLYVCDCSVIPEAWGMPPTTTIIALGKRLAKHLSG